MQIHMIMSQIFSIMQPKYFPPFLKKEPENMTWKEEYAAFTFSATSKVLGIPPL